MSDGSGNNTAADVRDDTGGGDETTPRLRAGTVLDDRYEIVSLLDGKSGGMGCVYVATDRRLSRPVVIKVMRRELHGSDDRLALKRRFAAEPIAAASIDHPSIIDIYDSRCDGEILYFVMPRLSGAMNLADRVAEVAERGGRLAVEELRAYGIQAAAGLWAAHEHGIVHRDIKPQNLLVRTTASGDHCLVIIDFGVSRRLATPMTRIGTALGTPAFHAPEYIQQVRGKRIETDHRIDLFALGVTLYFAATGRLPFEGDDEDTIYREICSHHPAPPSKLRPELPAGWDVVVMRLMQKDPAARYQSARELHADLVRVDELTGPVPEPTALHSAIVPPNEAVDADFLPPISGTVEGWRSPGDLAGDGCDSAEEPEPLPGAIAVRDGASKAALPSALSEGTRDRVEPAAYGPAVDAASVARVPAREIPQPDAPLPCSVAQFADAVSGKRRGRLAQLPRSTKVAIGVSAAAAALLLVTAVIGVGVRAKDPEQAKTETVSRAVESPAAGASDVTPRELLREQAQAKQRALLATAGVRTDSSPPQERAEPNARVKGSKLRRGKPKSSKRAAAKRQEVPSRGPIQATLASAPAPASAPTPAPTARRKDVSRVIRFHKPAKNEPQRANGTQTTTPLGIPTGTPVTARLVTPVRISDEQRSTVVIAELVAPLAFDDVGVVLPAGTRFVGQAGVVSRARRCRVEMSFSIVVLPDRSERSISAVATSSNGDMGVAARRIKEDRRALANLGEGAADVVDGLLDALPGRSATRRFAADARQEARDLRRVAATVSVAEGFEFVLRFVRPA